MVPSDNGESNDPQNNSCNNHYLNNNLWQRSYRTKSIKTTLVIFGSIMPPNLIGALSIGRRGEITMSILKQIWKKNHHLGRAVGAKKPTEILAVVVVVVVALYHLSQMIMEWWSGGV